MRKNVNGSRPCILLNSILLKQAKGYIDLNGKGIFFLENLFPNYEELVPYLSVNYFVPLSFGKTYPEVKLSPDMRR